MVKMPYPTLTRTSVPPILRKRLSVILQQGLDYFSLELGIVSHIADSLYTVIASESKTISIPDGTQYALKDTYCTDVVRTNKTKYFEDAATISELIKHPCYLNTQLRAYIGTPVFKDNSFWGTLNYSSLRPRKIPYSEADVEFLENQAKQIAQNIQLLW